MTINPEIRDQAYQFFIQEAPVLLHQIEAGLLTLKTERSTAKIHDLMRAAHSIKGGSASVDLDAIATLAHRLENIFKALYNEQIEIDIDLESQLLCAYDYLRLPLTAQITAGHFDAEQTLALADPIFTQLEERLGDALAQVDNYIPSSSELGVNIALSIFEVDVAEGLERLATVVANSHNYEVAGELRAQAEVFSGFAMLLDLPGFGAIAQTALEALKAHPELALEITQLALADFQAGREAVLRGDDTKGGSPCAALLALATGDWGVGTEDWGQAGQGDFSDAPPSTKSSQSPTPNPQSPIPNSAERAIEDLYASIPLLEEVFGSPVANSKTDLDNSFAVFETSQSFGEQIDQTVDRDQQLEEAWIGSIEELVSHTAISSQAETDVPDSSEVIDVELVAAAPSVPNAVIEEPPTLEEVFGNAVDTCQIEASASSAIVRMEAGNLPAVTSNALQQQHENLGESQDAPETLDAAVKSIEQLFENLPPIKNTPEVVSGSFVDTPVKRRVGEKQRTTDQSVTPKLSLRVDLDRLERMNNLVGELTINRNSLSLQNEQLQDSVRDLLNRFIQFQKMVGQVRELSDQMVVGASVGTQRSQEAKVGSLKVESFNRGLSNGYAEQPSNQRYPKRYAHAPQTGSASFEGAATLSQYGNGYAEREGQQPTTFQGQLTLEKSHFDSLEMDSYGALHSRLQGILEEMAQLEETVDDIALFARATNQTLQQQRQMQFQLRDELMWARMLPLSEVLNRFPRLLRDLSTTYHKLVSLKLNGTGVLVDRAVLERLYDPLVHLLRNAFDHGIEPPDLRRQLGKSEQGHIEISAYHKGSQTIIEVKDDGRGIQPELIRSRVLERELLSAQQLSKLDDAEVIQLIFEPGFSTANQVTELSGRGVGLDVLQAQLRSLKGTVTLTSCPGVGTTFTLRLPLTLTIAKLLICTVASSTLALPCESLEEIVIPKAGQAKQSGKQRFLHWREQLVPVYRVADLLDYACPWSETPSSKALIAVPSPEDWALPMLVIKQGQQFFALEIERLIAEQELVIKPFGAAIAPPNYTYGCTILGDGSLIPVIDGIELLEHFLGEGTGEWESKSGRVQESVQSFSDSATGRSPDGIVSPPHPICSSDYQQSQTPDYGTANKVKSILSTILVVDDSVALRRTLALSLERAGFRVLQARDGREAIEQLQKNSSTMLVICDIEMPNMNGFDFLNYRRQDPQLSKIPVIMLTSRSNNKHRWLAMHLGATDYFTKPYIEQTFLKTIKDIIRSQ